MKIFNLFVSLSFISIAFPFKGHAQTEQRLGTISGKIIDSRQNPISDVTIKLLKIKDSTLITSLMSETDGKFLFKGLKAGGYFIELTMISYEKQLSGEYLITSKGEAIDAGIIEMKNASIVLNEVKIINKASVIETDLNKTTINVASEITSSGKSAFEILANAPGVSLDKNGNVGLRGKRGVNVLINGKQTYLSSLQLAEYLKATMAYSIQKIEIISNPSSKYDASGNAGVINIILKKNKNYGTNGSFSIGGGFSKYYKSQVGFNFNHREEKFNLFGNLNGSDNETNDVLNVSRVNSLNGVKTYFMQNNQTLSKIQSATYDFGLDYFLNSKNTLGFEINGLLNKYSQNTTSTTTFGSSLRKVDSLLKGTYPAVSKYPKISYNLNYKSVLDSIGGELNADFDIISYNDSQNTNYYNYLFTGQGTPIGSIIYRNLFPSNISVVSSSINFVHPLANKAKIEVGLKSSWVNTDNNFKYDNLVGSNYILDTSQSSHFVYKENINAGYINLSKQFKNSSLQIGVRLENTEQNGNSITQNQIVSKSFTNLFPSFLYNLNIGDNNQLGFSFSRRIDRPSYSSLNPFRYYIDLYTSVQGNPYLSPQFTNSFELYYTLNKKLNVTLGYSKTTNVISSVIITDSLTKTIEQTMQNLAAQNYYDINLNYPLNIFKWWAINANTTLYYNKYYTPDLLGTPFNSGKFAYKINLNQNLSLDTTNNFEAILNYQSSEIFGPIAYKAYYNIDLGYSKSFLRKILFLKFSVSDILNTSKSTSTSLIPSENYSIFMKSDTRIFRISLDYHFGNSGIKGARQKNKASTSEENRAR